MNNRIFIERCETILVTMKAKNCQSVRTPEVAKWLEANDATAGQVLAKMCKFHLFKKVGAAQLTRYELSDECHNSFVLSINEYNDVLKAATKVVKYFVEHQKMPIPQQPDAKKAIDPKRKQAVEFLLELIKDNEDLKVEVELLREENAKLQEFKNKVTKLIQVI